MKTPLSEMHGTVQKILNERLNSTISEDWLTQRIDQVVDSIKRAKELSSTIQGDTSIDSEARKKLRSAQSSLDDAVYDLKDMLKLVGKR